MRRANIILIITYFLFILYFAIFNWEMFIVNLNINFGFAVLNMPMIIFIFIFGLCFLLIQWGMVNVYKFKLERSLVEKENEIALLKSTKFDSQLSGVERNQSSLKELHHKVNKVMRKLEIEDEQTAMISKEDVNLTATQQTAENEEKE